MPHQAIILAGGRGARLRPYTTLLPKALMPLGDLPVLELVLRQLKAHGFTQITLAVGHLAELIEAYFGNGKKFGVEITYVIEDKPLGTAGPIRTIEDLPEDFLVMNADLVSDIHYRDFFDYHRGRKSLLTLAAYRRTSQIDFGTLELDPQSLQVQAFVEKPILEHSVSMGIYVLNRRIADFIPPHEAFGFDGLIRGLLQAGEPVQAYPFNGYWLDIGRVGDYETAVNDYEAMKSVLLPQEEKPRPPQSVIRPYREFPA